jgi:hypothetical protein
MPVLWARMAGDIHRNRKIRRAGPDAREVFMWVLCQNALHNRGGWIPRADVTDFEHVAEELQRNAAVTENGFRYCVAHELLREEGDRVVIVGWDHEWSRTPLTNAERQARFKENKRLRALPSVTGNDDVTHNGNNESNVSEKRREDIESASSQSELDEPSDDDSGRKRKRPRDWKPTDRHRERVKAIGLGLDLDTEVRKFCEHHGAAGSKFASWNVAFSKWLTKAEQIAKQNGQSRQAGPVQVAQDTRTQRPPWELF